MGTTSIGMQNTVGRYALFALLSYAKIAILHCTQNKFRDRSSVCSITLIQLHMLTIRALDDAIADDKKYGNGPEVIARWARSRDGREVLMCAGIDPNERCVKGMMEFVGRGVRTSVALSREESERQAQAAAA